MYFTTFKQLLYTDLKIFKGLFKDKCIDLMIWILSMVLVTNYLMPSFGLSKNYTIFMVASLCSSAGLFEVWSSVVNLVNDFNGDQITSYYLTLPMPSWLVFLRAIVVYAINCIILGLLVLPISKLLLWYGVDLTHLHLGKFFIMIMLVSLFYGSFPIWISSKVKNMSQIGSVWMRFIYPIWFFGCFQFSWQVLYDISPWLAYLNLLNPITYVMEGTRAAVLGQEGSLPFWLSAGMLSIFSFLCAWYGISRLKKELDFV